MGATATGACAGDEKSKLEQDVGNEDITAEKSVQPKLWHHNYQERTGFPGTTLNDSVHQQVGPSRPNMASLKVDDDNGAMCHNEDKALFGKEARVSSVSDGNGLGSTGITGGCESLEPSRLGPTTHGFVVDTFAATTPMIAEMMICDFVHNEHIAKSPPCHGLTKFQSAFAEDIGGQDII